MAARGGCRLKYDWKETENILDFWTAVELLRQDSFDVCTDARAWRNEAETAKDIFRQERMLKENLLSKKDPAAKDALVRVRNFFRLGHRDELMEKIRNEARACGMSVWGNITVYIGRVRRENCILSLSEMPDLPSPKRSEKASDEIAVLSFQLTPAGAYLSGSLSFSPLIWALSKIENRQGKRISEVLQKTEYQKDLLMLEADLFGTARKTARPAAVRELSDKKQDALTKKDLKRIFRKISAMYLERYLKKETGKRASNREYYGIRLRFFKDEAARLAYDHNDNPGVGAGRFSEEITLTKELLGDGGFYATEMGTALTEYIQAPGRGEAGSNKRPRLDLMCPENRTQFADFIRDALDIRRAPLGKWLSGQPLSLMQQLAVNSAFSAGRDGSDNRIPTDGGERQLEPGAIFSVSAPPETGEAAVVKEIIAGNIVEKAKILASYEKADEAFQKHSVGRGENESGTGQESSFVWYSLKDDAIRNHSVLVLSADDEVWDDAAFSFGKRMNMSKIAGIQGEETDRTAGQQAERFRKACSDFSEQLRIVEEQQSELMEYRHCYDELKIRKNDHPELQRYEREAAEEKDRLEKLKARKSEKKDEMDALQRLYEEKKSAVWKKKTALTKAAADRRMHLADIDKHRKQIDDARKSTGFFSKLFNNTKYTTAMTAFNTARQKLADAEAAAGQLTQELAKLEEEKNCACMEVSDTKKEIDAAQKALDWLDSALKETDARRKAKQEKIRQFQDETDRCAEQLSAFRDAQNDYSGRIPDDDFIGRLLSRDEDTAAEAWRCSLWITADYDHEREKLLNLAQELIQAFAASSECCRENLSRLKEDPDCGMRTGDPDAAFPGEYKKEQEDREVEADALLQTLFLLSPAITITPEMVGAAFKDVKRPGSVGTLIVCGAEQMEPQVAVGALCRSRKAVVIGDRSQSGPVFTDDLDILKNICADESCRPYADKTLSAQYCADLINPIGTGLIIAGPRDKNEPGSWIGCPLPVHSGSIRPMFDLMNRFVYGGMLKLWTSEPMGRTHLKFARPKSQWLNVGGRENGGFDHYVKKQGQLACSIVDTAFSKDNDPDLFIITPFATVAEGIKRELKRYYYEVKGSSVGKSANLFDWIESNIGMIHEFQGKTAGEAIFLLGCDDRRSAADAVRQVDRRDVNTVVTRAAYRLYVIGDISVWRKNAFVRDLKNALDMNAFREISALMKNKSVVTEDERKDKLRKAAGCIPSSTSFIRMDGWDPDGEIRYVIDTDDFVRELNRADFLKINLTAGRLKRFGFQSKAEFGRLSSDIRRCLTAAVKLYELLKPVYDISPEADASCCGILFCRALELQAAAAPVDFSEYTGGSGGDDARRDGFIDDFDKCVRLRSRCCHPNLFKWNDLEELLFLAFGAGIETGVSENADRREGVFFRCVRLGKRGNNKQEDGEV